MARTALVTGASGFLGRQVFQAFKSAGWNVVGTGLTRASPPEILQVDLTNTASVQSVLLQVKPEVVVHCAANRFPDKCEQNPAKAKQINIEASRHLAQTCSNAGIFLIYISTDYVFSGKPGEAPYEADAETYPTTLYGQTKLDGERAVLECTRDSSLGVVLRVPLLYGKANEPKESAVNVLMETLRKAQENDAKFKMDNWAQRYPTNTEDVARVCVDLATKYLEEGEARQRLPKMLQFSSEDKFTKYEIVELFAEIMGLGMGGIEVDEEQSSVQRPYDSHLSTQALRDTSIKVHTQDFKAWWRWEVKAFRK